MNIAQMITLPSGQTINIPSNGMIVVLIALLFFVTIISGMGITTRRK